MSTSPINDVKGPVRKSGGRKAAGGKCPKTRHNLSLGKGPVRKSGDHKAAVGKCQKSHIRFQFARNVVIDRGIRFKRNS